MLDELRTRLSYCPGRNYSLAKLATARRDAAADAWDHLAVVMRTKTGSSVSADTVSRWAAEVRSGARTVLSSKEED